MAEAMEQTRDRVSRVGDALTARMRERPYPVLALAAMAGYVVGGGLFSSFTRPLARSGLALLLVPGVRERLRGMSDELRSMQPAGAA